MVAGRPLIARVAFTAPRHVGVLFLALAWVCLQVDGLPANKCSSAAGTVEKDDGHHDGRYQDEEQ